MEVRVESNKKMVQNELGQIMSQIPEVEEDFAEDIMEMAVEEIQRSADQRFDDFTGNMNREISMRNVTRTRTDNGAKLTLTMKGETDGGADYLAWNEYADSGHWVKVTRENSPIKEWADEKLTDNPEFIFVSPTPFVKPAVQKIARRARQKMDSDDNAVAQLARVH